MKQVKLLKASDVGEALGITKQAVLLAVREGRLPEPKYKLGSFNGWTKEQVDEMAKEWKNARNG